MQVAKQLQLVAPSGGTGSPESTGALFPQGRSPLDATQLQVNSDAARLHHRTEGAAPLNHMSPRTPSKLLDQLRARGIRLTSQRVVLINILDAQEGFLDIPSLCAMARRRGAAVDRATVYRTLAMLRANNLLSATGGGRGSQADGSSPATHDEFSLICQQCGNRQPIPHNAPEVMKRQLERCTGFDARAVHLVASGECRLCSAKSRLGSKSRDKPAN